MTTEYHWTFYMPPVHCLLLAILCLSACASPKPQNPEKGTFYLSSHIYQEERKIYIQLPKNLQENTNKSYPVVVVLDGDHLFEYVAGLVPLMTDMNLLPESIVIGIPHLNRNKELTPDPIDGTPETGGGRKFAEFLARELFPFLDQQYPVLDYRTIIGHSYGGLWTLFALQEHSELFSNYIAIDPSYQFYQNRPLTALNKTGPRKRLYLAIANTLTSDQDTATLNNTETNSHIYELFQFRDQLLAADSSAIVFSWSYYPDHSHMTIPIPGIYDGLKTTFSWYPMIIDSFSMRDNPHLSKKMTQQYISTYIDLLKTEMGASFLPDNLLLRRIAWKNYSLDKTLTLELLLLNYQLYPDNFDANHALGLYYYYQKQMNEASRYLRQASKIRQDTSVHKLLQTIEALLPASQSTQ